MDERARRDFADFVAARSAELLRLAYVLTGDQHSAEDLLQNALTRAAAHWGRIHSAPEGYVRRILYREQVNRWRRGARRRETAVAQVPELATQDPADSADTRLALRGALLALPPGKRAVLVLRRRNRIAARTGLVVAGAVVVAVAAVVIPRAIQGAPIPVPAAPIELRVPLMFRPVAVIEDHRCRNLTDVVGSAGWPGEAGDSPGPGQPSAYCFYLTGPAVTVNMLEYARIASDGVSVQLRVRLPRAEAERLAALSKKLINQPAPRNRLAIVVGKRIISAPEVVARIPVGRFWLRVATRAYAERLLRELRGSRRGD